MRFGMPSFFLPRKALTDSATGKVPRVTLEPSLWHLTLNAYANGNPISYVDPFGTSAELGQAGHTLLDAAGMIPGVGMLFDTMNAIWYLAEGDWTNAGLSAIAFVPIVGDVAGGAKLGIKAVKAADELVDVAKGAEKVTNAVDTAKDIGKNINKVSENYLKSKGIDAHALKKEIVGKNFSKYDIYVNKNTGELIIFGKGGTGEGMPTGEFIK